MSRIFTPLIHSRQTIACSLLEAAVVQEKLAHAYLLAGRADDDKWLLTQQLACYLNCGKKDQASCIMQQLSPDQCCQNCRWILEDAHPQAWLKLTGEESKTGRISVEKARLLADELSKTSIYFRVVVIPQAQQDIFHRPSANALLKTIEEPGPNTLFILFASHEEAVLPTIVSRCQIITVPKSQPAGFWLSAEFEKLEIENKVSELKTVLQQDENHQYDFTSIKTATSTLSSTLAWAAKIEKLSDDLITPGLIFDLVVASEIELLRSSATDNPQTSSYLHNLLKLAETAKNQIEHHVQPKSAIDSFALACHQLCHGASSIVRL